MFFSKQKMHLGDFARMFIVALLQKRYDFSDVRGSLPDELENKILNRELEYFKIILLAFHLNEISKFGKRKYKSHEIWELIGYSILMVCKDIGKSETEANSFADTLSKRIKYYTDSLSKVDETELETKGVYFYLITFFTNLIVASSPVKIIKNEILRTQHFTVFNLAAQIYRDDEKVLSQVLKQTKFLDK